MRVLLRSGGSFLTAGSLLIAGTTSRADELLVMPYSCTVSGGQLALIPSDDKGYRILGRRERQNFTACSPGDPTKCRKWTVHRFDVDCSGARVSWASVVAASDGRRRVWVEGGSLHIRMPWTWALPKGDPCARLSELDERRPRYRQLARRCEFRKSRSRDSIVEMPHGFAPKFGIDAIFVAGAPQQGPNVPAGDPSARAPRRTAQEMRDEVPPVPPRISQSQRKAATENGTADSVSSSQIKTASVSPPAEVQAALVAAGNPPSLTIINRRGSDVSNATPGAPTVAESNQTTVVAAAEETAKSDDGDAQTLKNSLPNPNPKKEQSLQSQMEANAGGLVGYLRNPMTVAVTTLALLCAILIAGFALIRRRDASHAQVATSRDIGSVWLEKNIGLEESSAALISTNANEAPLSNRHLPATQSGPKKIAGQNWGDTIPQNRSEALGVLGIGDSSDVNQTAIKKIVDGLRMSWHPDHADGEDDRKLRELRLKQINVAWEIISEARAEEHV